MIVQICLPYSQHAAKTAELLQQSWQLETLDMQVRNDESARNEPSNVLWLIIHYCAIQ